jgi:uncharacterized protein
MKKLSVILFVLMLATVLSLTACSSQSSTNQGGESNGISTNEGKSENKKFDPNDRSSWPKNVRVGSASVGGAYYVYAGSWATIVSDQLGITTNVEQTGGPNHNIQLIENGDLELGMTTLGPAYDAWYGEGEWTNGKKFREFRVMFPMYPSLLHFWSLSDSGIEEISDFEGKSVGVGPKGGTPGTYFPQILDILGVKSKLINAGYSDMTSQQLDGLLDVMGWAGSVPAGAAMEILAQKDLNFIGFTEEQADKVISELDYFSKVAIPAGTYEGQDKDIIALDLFNVAIADKDLPDSLVYNIVDAVLGNHDRLVETFSAAVDTIPENIGKNTFAYMHPGAIKWYEEHGIELPDEVYPPEYKK